jgi:hypothetical protein
MLSFPHFPGRVQLGQRRGSDTNLQVRAERVRAHFQNACSVVIPTKHRNALHEKDPGSWEGDYRRKASKVDRPSLDEKQKSMVQADNDALVKL